MDNKTARILFVDDDASLRTVVPIALSRDSHQVDTADCGETALEMFAAHHYDLVIHDIRMPGMDGLELLRRLTTANATVPVVVMTAFSTWNIAMEAMRLGAYDYIKKPFDNNDLRQLAKRALAFSGTGGEGEGNMTWMIGASSGMKEIQNIIQRVAKTDSTVLIQGESGSGKELVAANIHAQSQRNGRSFIAVNCGGFSETLLESELFGHVKGAFTGAVSDKNGLLQLADGGTFFLDEVGETSLATQVRLLRVLETRTFLPVGDETPRKVDVRFIAATNRDLREMADAGAFRADLFYRLNVISVNVPSLRDRRDDIPLLAGHFLSLYASRFKKRIDGFTDEAMAAILAHDWPGNVRELQNAVQRAVSLADDSKADIRDVFPAWAPIQPTRNAVANAADQALRREPAVNIADIALSGSGFDLEEKMAEIEGDYIRQALLECGNNSSRAAEMLGITLRSFRYKMKKLGLDK
ncbi:MAG: sigma-54 dependent transcriptional regulator [Planctomycetota bacterium]|jgi:DNA-binding NtrC family response regulator|nr:sigma-54 dependent transcriptional regulator [Planctomycetota bacterium]